MEIPLFPLNTVIFPGGVLPLRIFEPRYLDMVSNCLRTNTGFGVFLIKSGRETGQPAQTHRIGTLCKIIDWTMLPDGLLGITASGESKISMLSSKARGDHLLIGQVEAAALETDEPLPPEFEALSELLEHIVAEMGPPYSDLPGRYRECGWVGARLTELLPLDLKHKQRLLEINDARARLSELRQAAVNLQYL
jgi:Lon protease-like protein